MLQSLARSVFYRGFHFNCSRCPFHHAPPLPAPPHPPPITPPPITPLHSDPGVVGLLGRMHGGAKKRAARTATVRLGGVSSSSITASGSGGSGWGADYRPPGNGLPKAVLSGAGGGGGGFITMQGEPASPSPPSPTPRLSYPLHQQQQQQQGAGGRGASPAEHVLPPLHLDTLDPPAVGEDMGILGGPADSNDAGVVSPPPPPPSGPYLPVLLTSHDEDISVVTGLHSPSDNGRTSAVSLVVPPSSGASSSISQPLSITEASASPPPPSAISLIVVDPAAPPAAAVLGRPASGTSGGTGTGGGGGGVADVPTLLSRMPPPPRFPSIPRFGMGAGGLGGGGGGSGGTPNSGGSGVASSSAGSATPPLPRFSMRSIAHSAASISISTTPMAGPGTKAGGQSASTASLTSSPILVRPVSAVVAAGGLESSPIAAAVSTHAPINLREASIVSSVSNGVGVGSSALQAAAPPLSAPGGNILPPQSTLTRSSIAIHPLHLSGLLSGGHADIPSHIGVPSSTDYNGGVTTNSGDNTSSAREQSIDTPSDYTVMQGGGGAFTERRPAVTAATAAAMGMVNGPLIPAGISTTLAFEGSGGSRVSITGLTSSTRNSGGAGGNFVMGGGTSSNGTSTPDSSVLHASRLITPWSPIPYSLPHEYYGYPSHYGPPPTRPMVSSAGAGGSERVLVNGYGNGGGGGSRFEASSDCASASSLRSSLISPPREGGGGGGGHRRSASSSPPPAPPSHVFSTIIAPRTGSGASSRRDSMGSNGGGGAGGGSFGTGGGSAVNGSGVSAVVSPPPRAPTPRSPANSAATLASTSMYSSTAPPLSPGQLLFSQSKSPAGSATSLALSGGAPGTGFSPGAAPSSSAGTNSATVGGTARDSTGGTAGGGVVPFTSPRSMLLPKVDIPGADAHGRPYYSLIAGEEALCVPV